MYKINVIYFKSDQFNPLNCGMEDRADREMHELWFAKHPLNTLVNEGYLWKHLSK